MPETSTIHILELPDVEQEPHQDDRLTQQRRLPLLPFHPIINHSLLLHWKRSDSDSSRWYCQRRKRFILLNNTDYLSVKWNQWKIPWIFNNIPEKCLFRAKSECPISACHRTGGSVKIIIINIKIFCADAVCSKNTHVQNNVRISTVEFSVRLFVVWNWCEIL